VSCCVLFLLKTPSKFGAGGILGEKQRSISTSTSTTIVDKKTLRSYYSNILSVNNDLVPQTYPWNGLFYFIYEVDNF